jgi:hypothetical protein
MDIAIRGTVYPIADVADTQILPLAKVFGLKPVPDQDSPLYERWKIDTTNVFMEPANQAAVAYVLISLFPDLDPAIACHRIKRYDEGYSEIDFHLAINMDELLAVLEAVNPFIQKRTDQLQTLKTGGKGFGNAVNEVKSLDKNKDTQIAALKAQIQELETAGAS